MFSTAHRLLRHGWLTAWRRIEFGTFHFTTPEGEAFTFTGTKPGPEATMVLYDWGALRRILARGDIGLGEEYIAGRWETASVEALISLFLLNLDHIEDYANGTALSRIGFAVVNRFLNRNSRRGSRSNISKHYDVGNAFYRLWLDESMTYSSALFAGKDIPLKEAQHAKYGRILDKIGDDRKHILEIGCGWGGFAEDAANRGHQLTGLTISPAQYDFAHARLAPFGDQVKLQLTDYRDIRGTFDAIVSIEMVEAVGEAYWPAYFATIRDRLAKDGRAIIQGIVIRDELFPSYRKQSDFIRHYVFPGGMLPSLVRFREEAAKAGLAVREVFSFGQDYAETLRRWTTRLEEAREQILALGYSEPFIRNWRFYLGECAASFAVSRTDVAQIELSHA